MSNTVDRRMRLVQNGEEIGFFSHIHPMQEIADERGLDLEQVSESPPVFRLVDLGQENYRKAQALKASKAKNKKKPVKTVQFNATIAPADLSVKLRRAIRFLKAGHDVRFELQLKRRNRGRVNDFMGWLPEKLGELTQAFHSFSLPAVTAAGATISLKIQAKGLVPLSADPGDDQFTKGPNGERIQPNIT